MALLAGFQQILVALKPRADPVLVTLLRSAWTMMHIPSHCCQSTPYPLPVNGDQCKHMQHSWLTLRSPNGSQISSAVREFSKFTLFFAMCRNYRTFGCFWNYWSYIVQRVKLSYKYDNYRTSGNTGHYREEIAGRRNRESSRVDGWGSRMQNRTGGEG